MQRFGVDNLKKKCKLPVPAPSYLQYCFYFSAWHLNINFGCWKYVYWSVYRCIPDITTWQHLPLNIQYSGRDWL